MSQESGGEEKPRTIRGIDPDLYDRALALSRQTGKTVGQVINDALSNLLNTFDSTVNKVQEVGRAFVEGMQEGRGNSLSYPTLMSLRSPGTNLLPWVSRSSSGT
jgi:hypothetical protein